MSERASDPALLEDLLEVSDSLKHRRMAVFQIMQYNIRKKLETEMDAWGSEEMRGGANPAQIHSIIAHQLEKIWIAQAEELALKAEAEDVEQAGRDQGIFEFLHSPAPYDKP